MKYIKLFEEQIVKMINGKPVVITPSGAVKMSRTPDPGDLLILDLYEVGDYIKTKTIHNRKYIHDAIICDMRYPDNIMIKILDQEPSGWHPDVTISYIGEKDIDRKLEDFEIATYKYNL